jgi:hypothetical protein
MAVVFFMNLTGCNTVKNTSQIPNDYAFVVQGVSGKQVMLDRTWYQDCISGGEGVWMKSMRTLSGHELSTTVNEYQNGSKTPNCNEGAASITIFVQSLKNDHVRVPIKWTDSAGNAASAPAGLENVKEGNGATGLITFATMTLITQAKADQMNGVKFCGKSDWKNGGTVNILPCFPVNPAKGTVIVDDRTGTGMVYDGISVNPAEYPNMMPNKSPHQGPLNGIKF